MPTVNLPQFNDQRLFYTRPQQSESGHQVVLIHGAGGSHLDWPPQVQRLTAASVCNLDLPGHGRSSPPAYASVDDYAQRVLAFVAALQLDSVVLVGHSLGGAIAQVAALQQPQALAGLVLLGTAARLRVADLILDAALAQPETAAEFITRHAWGPDAPSAARQRGKGQLMQTEPEALFGDFLACNSFDVRDRLDEIGVPTLVIAGAEDKMVPLKYSEALAQGIAQAELVVLPGTGHYIALEAPEETAAAIGRFLARLPATR